MRFDKDEIIKVGCDFFKVSPDRIKIEFFWKEMFSLTNETFKMVEEVDNTIYYFFGFSTMSSGSGNVLTFKSLSDFECTFTTQSDMIWLSDYGTFAKSLKVFTYNSQRLVLPYYRISLIS